MAMGQSIDVQLVDVNGQVTQKPFDDFHLYDLNRTVSLRDGETKGAGYRVQARELVDSGKSVSGGWSCDVEFGLGWR
jgi:hypothetical protein